MKSTLLLAPLLASALALPSALPQDDPPGVAQIRGVAERRLQQGDLDRAMGNLARLAALCGTCEERHELDAAIRALQAP